MFGNYFNFFLNSMTHFYLYKVFENEVFKIHYKNIVLNKTKNISDSVHSSSCPCLHLWQNNDKHVFWYIKTAGIWCKFFFVTKYFKTSWKCKILLDLYLNLGMNKQVSAVNKFCCIIKVNIVIYTKFILKAFCMSFSLYFKFL